MTIKEQFEIEWAKLSTLKDPIQKETAELWFRLGHLAADQKHLEKLKDEINGI